MNHASTLDLSEFELHDVSRFPIVCLHGRGLPNGYGPQWAKEMETLLHRNEPFALVFPDSVENEAHEDQALRARWLKANKERLAAVCRAVVGVEPNKALRLMKRAQGLAIAAAFGLNFRITATVEEAEKLAALALQDEVLPDDVERP
jgi:hypothetical protein